MRGPDQPRTDRARRLRQQQTDAERRLWARLRNRQLAGFKFTRQEPIGPYFADFCCQEHGLVVELDGSQHVDNDREAVRDAFLEREGYRILRFWNPEVFSNMSGVIETILASLHRETPPQPRQGSLGPFLARGER